MEALERSRTPRELQPVVEFVGYLHENSTHGQPDKPCLDIRCSATWALANSGLTPFEVCRTEYKQTYWTHRQLVAHQTRNGSRIGTGDLIGTGTMSMFQVGEHPWENECYVG
jgi:2-keto-4-pentenoate hydratase/2-oxohepta-3-ene-1,7-dioic acid hydratase in catechol pathway